MGISQNTQHVLEALSNRIEQFEDKENFADLITAYVAQVQDLEDALFEVLLETTLETSIGQQLDNIGEIIKEDRLSRIDDDYRRALRVRILVNKSSGTIEEILEITKLFTQLTSTITIEEFPPASFTIRFGEALPTDPLTTITLLDSARGAGIGFQLLYFLSTESDIFRFASGDVLEASATQGFGNDGQTTGGKLADAIMAGE